MCATEGHSLKMTHTRSLWSMSVRTRQREAMVASEKKDMKMVLGLHIRTNYPERRHAGMSVVAIVN